MIAPGFITMVCSFPRAGSSLTMGMLQAGGMSLYYDPDKEIAFETVMNTRLPSKSDWLQDCYGKAVKILEPLTYRPPMGHDYRVIWLNRNLKEQAKSTCKFARRVSGLSLRPGADKAFEESYRKELPASLELLRELTRGHLLELSFEAILKQPSQAAAQIADFLGLPLDVEAMAKTVIKREARCLPYLLETKIIHQSKVEVQS